MSTQIREVPEFACPAPDLGYRIQLIHRTKALQAIHASLAAILSAEITKVEGMDFMATDVEVLDAVLVLWATGDAVVPPMELQEIGLTATDWQYLLVHAAGQALRDTTTAILVNWS